MSPNTIRPIKNSPSGSSKYNQYLDANWTRSNTIEWNHQIHYNMTSFTFHTNNTPPSSLSLSLNRKHPQMPTTSIQALATRTTKQYDAGAHPTPRRARLLLLSTSRRWSSHIGRCRDGTAIACPFQETSVRSTLAKNDGSTTTTSPSSPSLQCVVFPATIAMGNASCGFRRRSVLRSWDVPDATATTPDTAAVSSPTSFHDWNHECSSAPSVPTAAAAPVFSSSIPPHGRHAAAAPPTSWRDDDDEYCECFE